MNPPSGSASVTETTPSSLDHPQRSFSIEGALPRKLPVDGGINRFEFGQSRTDLWSSPRGA
jgi:hypothetical protein